MATSNYIKNVAVVGAGGNSGNYMTECLIKGGKHTVTAITRINSQSKLPEGIHQTKQIDYDKPETIVEALKGQDALVITLAPTAPHDLQPKLIEAAAKAGVQWILPNGWSPDTDPTGVSAGVCKDVFVFGSKEQVRQHIKKLGVSYIDVCTGFWYEWSLAIPPSFGFDFKSKQITYFDNGDTPITISTWPQVGRAVAALLSLPIKPEGNSKGNLEELRNKIVYVSSFTVSQQDMFESVLRVTGDKREDWKITKQSSQARYEEGKEELAKGNRVGFAKMMYSRVFYPDGNGNYEKSRGTLNDILELPKENIDDGTKRAIKRASENSWP